MLLLLWNSNVECCISKFVLFLCLIQWSQQLLCGAPVFWAAFV